MRKLSQVLVSAVAVCLCSAPAWATHKSWNLVDPGANCRSSFSGGTAAQFRFTDGMIKNNGTSSAGVWCPVTLAGRYGSTNAFNMARWPTSRAATVYGFDGSSTDDIRCNMIVMSDTGSIYSSATKSVAGANNSVVQISMVSSGSWGLDIGTGTTLSIRSMGYNCNVPPGSSIYAYEEKICQYPQNNTPNGVCAGGDTTPTQTSDAPTSAVTQDSGFACLADASNPTGSMWRNGGGIQNSGSTPLNVYCPLSRTSSDSRTQQGTFSIDRVQVYSSGDTPTCKLTCRSQFTGSVTSSSNTIMGAGLWMDPTFPPQLPILVNWTPCAGALGASCSLPSLTTLLGFLHQDEIPPVDNGI